MNGFTFLAILAVCFFGFLSLCILSMPNDAIRRAPTPCICVDAGA